MSACPLLPRRVNGRRLHPSAWEKAMRQLHNCSVPVLACALVTSLLISQTAAAAPLAEKYLLEGKLTEGAKALQERLKESPKDDQARFGLGMVQFLQTFEH